MNLIIKKISEIKKSGLKIFFKKFKTLIIIFFYLPIYILSFFFLLIIYILQPFYLIRFDNCNSSRIGHFATNTELYLCEREAKINTPQQKYLDLFFFDLICNQQLAKMWKKKIIVLPKFIIKPIFLINKFISNFFSFAKKHQIQTSNNDRDTHNLLDIQKPNLNFTKDEINKGESFLKKFSLNINSKFVCFIIRDNAYLNFNFPEKNWDYHDHRNFNVDNFFEAAEALAERGYHIFRMGKKVEKKFISSNSKIIDYANLDDRSDFLDIFLCAHSNFCISTACGLDAVAKIFRVPIGYIQVEMNYLLTFSKKDLIMTKHHYSNMLNRKLNFKDLIDKKIANFNSKKNYDENDINFIENPPEEIKEFALEMLDRYENKWKDSKEDEKMQNKFWENYRIFLNKCNLKHKHEKIKAKFSISFLRRNPEWLELF